MKREFSWLTFDTSRITPHSHPHCEAKNLEDAPGDVEQCLTSQEPAVSMLSILNETDPAVKLQIWHCPLGFDLGWTAPARRSLLSHVRALP